MTYSELNRVCDLRGRLAAESRKLEALRLKATSLCRQLDGMPRSKPLTSTPEKLATAIVEAEQRIIEMTAEQDALATALSAGISARIRNDTIAAVLIMYFCAGEPLSEIARRLNRRSNAILRLWRQGVEKLTRVT